MVIGGHERMEKRELPASLRRNNESLSTADEVRENIAWTRKKSFDATGLSKSEIYAALAQGSTAVVGLPDYGVSRVVSVEFPRVSANTEESRRLVNEAAAAIYRKSVENALRSGQITDDEYLKNLLIMGVPGGLTKHPPAGEPALPMGRAEAVAQAEDAQQTNTHEIPMAASVPQESKKSLAKRGVIVIAGVAMLLSSCAPVIDASPTSVSQPNSPENTPDGGEEPAPEPTEQAMAMPTAIAEQLPQLAAAGYRFEERTNGWALINKNGEPAITSTETPNMSKIVTENGEEVEFLNTAFEDVPVEAAGIESIQVVKNSEGEVEYFLLDKEGYWATPIEFQTNPEDLENYTQITLEDMWSGRVLYSEALRAEPFPDGTIVPDNFVYRLWQYPRGTAVDLIAWFDEAAYNHSSPEFQEVVNSDNDYRRWIAFYKVIDPSGDELIVGTQQVLNSDGKTSLFFHHQFGKEMNWDENHGNLNSKYTVLNSVFRARESGNTDNSQKVFVDPTIFFQGISPEATEKFFSIFGNPNVPPTSGIDLYADDRNNPLLISPGLETMIRDAMQNPDFKFGGNLPFAGDEVEQLQYMFLLGGTSPLHKDYFNASN